MRSSADRGGADLDWQDRSACRDAADPDLWFPDAGGHAGFAKAVCATCPVQRECLQFAIEQDMKFGVWGGLSRNGRDELLRRRERGTPFSRWRRATSGAGS